MTNKRSRNMKRVSVSRSAEVTAMLDLLLDLDNGTGGDFGGMESFGIKHNSSMEGRINSYRAQKIAMYLGKNISKSHLIKFSKDKDVLSERDKRVFIGRWGNSIIQNKVTVDEFIEEYGESLLAYWQYSKGFYINNALMELNSSHS